MTTRPLALGLDIGSTSIKGAVLNDDGEPVAALSTRPFPAPLPDLPAGWFEVSLAQVEQAVLEVVRELLAAAPEATRLFCSGQMGGVVVVDPAGNPLTNYLSWRDQRTLGELSPGVSYLEEIRRRWPDDLLASLGRELQPGSTASLLFWLAQQGKLPTGASFTTVADAVVYRGVVDRPRMHATQAIGLLDLATTRWHDAAFAKLGLSGVRWPELDVALEPPGKLTIAGRTLEVVGAFGDQQCALRGVGLRPGELSINVSTGSQVSIRAERFEPGAYQTRLYFDGDWLNTITHLPAGRSLNVLVDLLTELARAEGIELRRAWANIVERATAESTAVAVEELQANLALFAGPCGSSGAITGITTENLSVGRLFRAAFRSMADNYAWAAARLAPGRAFTSVAISGGLTQAAPILRRLIQDRFPAPLREFSGDETLTGLRELARDVARQESRGEN